MLFLISCGPQVQVYKETTELGTQDLAQSEELDADNFKIVVFDVGEGDSALIVAPNGEAALIDTGLFGSWNIKIKPFLEENDQIDLKYLIITHDDNDHNGDINNIGIAPYEFTAGDVVELGGNVELKILAKDCAFSDGTNIPCEDSDDNAHSAVILIEYDGFKYLATGDLPGGGGEPPYETTDLETKIAQLAGDLDVLRVGHHGSNTSTNQNLLDITKPEAAIISVGNNNDYWHPHASTIERLLDAGVKIFQTETGWLMKEFNDDVNVANGNIIIETTASSYYINNIKVL